MPLDEKPIILREGVNTLEELNALKQQKNVWREVDIFESQLKELFEITHASLVGSDTFAAEQQAFIEEKKKTDSIHLAGNWVYFPWSGRLVHMLPQHEYEQIRTNRNRNLVTQEEQETLLRFPVGIVGLSVGSNVATALTYSGIANTMKLAEFDTLETTNLNRIRARVDQIGESKLKIVTEQVYDVNPYAEFIHFSEGLNRSVLERFFTEEPRPRLVFEIIDSFEMKIHLRSLAKKYRIPVIMVTNLGDRVLLDVERYDVDPTIPFFNGRAGNVPEEMVTNPDVTSAQKHHYAVALAGVEHIPKRALDSVAEIGKTLVGRPQLASTVTIAAGCCAYFTRKIALNDNLPSGSWLVDLDQVFQISTAL